MKLRIIPLVALVALLATGCKDAPVRSGRALAQEFFDAWGDTAALKQVEQHYHAVSDSMWMPNATMHLLKAFLEGTARNDSMRAIAQLMAYDREDYARLQAYRIMGDRHDVHFNADSARVLLQLIDWSAGFMGKQDYADAARAMIDSQVQSLDVEQQMAIYTAVATPTTLGLELKADRESPDADHKLIERQVRELERIYSAQQLQEFRAAYGQ